MIDAQVLTALQAELTRERQNAAIYDALAASLNAVNWPGSAAFLAKSAGEEREHAQKFSDYIVDRNALPQYGALEICPALDGDDLVEYFQAALETEQGTTAAINTLFRLADDRADAQTEIFLHFFVDEQTDSERVLYDFLLELRRYAGDPDGYKLFDNSLE